MLLTHTQIFGTWQDFMFSFFKKKIVTYLFSTVLGLRCCAGFSSVVSWGYSLVMGQGLHCGGFSCWGARALEHMGFSSWGVQALEHRGFSSWGMNALEHMGFSSWGAQALKHRLSSCGTWA